MKLQFYLRFSTRYGQSLYITGNIAELGNDDPQSALLMSYLNDQLWVAEIDIKAKQLSQLHYKYILKGEDGELIMDAEKARAIDFDTEHASDINIIDTWNHTGEYENVFFTTPFQNVLFDNDKHPGKLKTTKNTTHVFRVKSPLLQKHEAVCLLGAGSAFKNWNTEEPLIMQKDGQWWSVAVDLSEENSPLPYKYGIFNTQTNSFIRYEGEDNRLVYSDAGKKRLTILNDGFVYLPNNWWKGAGVAVPVFSLRTKNGFGTGEFPDIKVLVDWAKKTGLKLIQILPVNDTTATHTYLDSYPYAAISAFALHPLFANLDAVAGKKHASVLTSIRNKQKQLNEEDAVDYEEVMKFKWTVLRELYELQQPGCFEEDDYKDFFKHNKHWLIPYAAFCYFRDLYKTSHYENWETNSQYSAAAIEKLLEDGSKTKKELGFHFFVQYQLHLQLKDAVDYAHKKGVVIKGDIPIGIYRYGADAWVAPGLYNMNMQAGAPPDDFAVKGQNWGFPTYNWQRMQEDGFLWWRQRFEQMSNYFDAFRIDHILGFFRIWSIPINAVQGIMGHFVPAIPVRVTEFGENGIWFDYHRYCRPYITHDVLNELFHEQKQFVIDSFLDEQEDGTFDLKPEFDTQRKTEQYFDTLEKTELNNWLRETLYDLIANVILFEAEGSGGTEFHFRLGMENTLTFRYLDVHTQQKLRELSINYFFRRQDDFWRKEAMHKLPYLKSVTNMLICGEDLGMVPACVPDVMKELGILSLEIQRMPKALNKEFADTQEAPYLSVVTPSTHDMSTVRGWWEEDRTKTQHFFNNILHQHGDAPFYCEAWVNRAIVLQHLYCPAMWSIFQLQDILGMSEKLRRENPNDERINIPADPKHYWRYRMHLYMEDLLNEEEFNNELKGYISHSGR